MQWIAPLFLRLAVPSAVRQWVVTAIEILDSPHSPAPTRRRRIAWAVVTGATGFVDQCRVPHDNGEPDAETTQDLH